MPNINNTKKESKLKGFKSKNSRNI